MDSLQVAIEHGSEEDVKRIIEKDPSQLFVPIEEGNYALHYAAWHDNPRIVQLLLLSGADINARGERMWTPLHFAAYYTCPRSSEMLILNGAGLDLKDHMHRTAMYMTTQNKLIGGSTILGLLIHHGACLDLSSAAALGMTEIVRCMLFTQPRLVQTIDNSDELLPDSIRTEKADLVRLLLSHGANPNRSLWSPPPLALAGDVGAQGDLTIAKLLLEHGADPGLPSPITGLTPIQHAKRHSNTRAMELYANWHTR